jgi:hypothetical protein
VPVKLRGEINMKLNRIAMCALGAAMATGAFAQSQTSATGLITLLGTGGGLYNYDINLTNNGSTGIQTFWFSWVPGLNFMPDSPSNITGPTGWTDTITSGPGFAIQWKTSGGLAAGNSLDGFDFSSPDSISVLEGMSNGFPILTSFVYSGQPLSGTSDQFVVGVNSAPEPASWLAFGGLGLVVLGAKRRRASGKA